MKTLLEITRLSTDFLAKKGITHPKREAEWLISETLGLKRLDIYTQHDRPVTDEEMARLRPLLERRGKREPLQYILGKVDFLDCIFRVSPAVLIPRPETEILADKIVKELLKSDVSGKTLWDICTGSGCLGISIKKKVPALNVVLSDISPEALAIAKENAALNEVEVAFLQGDLLTPFQGEKAHYIVSNPPYVSAEEYTRLEPEVRDFEPHGALVSGKNGKEIYTRLADELPHFLEPDGKIWLEIGPPDTAELFKSEVFGQVKTELDWSGKPRFVTIDTHNREFP